MVRIPRSISALLPHVILGTFIFLLATWYEFHRHRESTRHRENHTRPDATLITAQTETARQRTQSAPALTDGLASTIARVISPQREIADLDVGVDRFGMNRDPNHTYHEGEDRSSQYLSRSTNLY